MKSRLALVCLLAMTLAQNVMAIQIVDNTQYVIESKSGQYVDIIPLAEAVEGQLEAGGEVSEESYIIAMMDDGSLQFVPKQAIDELVSLEGVMRDKIGTCTSDTDCYNLANAYCSAEKSNWVALKPQIGSGTKCYKGVCNAECVIATGCSSATCANNKVCAYCIKNNAYCSGSTCIQQICGDAGWCKDNGYISEQSLCSPSDSQDKLIELCDAKRPSGSITTSAKCIMKTGSSAYEPVCGYQGKGGEECTRTSDCTTKYAMICGGADKVDYAKCNVEFGCNKQIIRSNCVGKCVITDPSVYTPPPTQPPDNRCGNTKCEEGETKVGCPIDCGLPEAVKEPSCEPGLTGNLKCSKGKYLVQQKVFASCVIQWEVLQECPVGCENGACVIEDLSGLPSPNDPFWDDYTNPEVTDPRYNFDTDALCGDGVCEPLREDGVMCPQDCVINGGGAPSVEDYTTVIIVIAIIGLGATLFYLMRQKQE